MPGIEYLDRQTFEGRTAVELEGGRSEGATDNAECDRLRPDAFFFERVLVR